MARRTEPRATPCSCCIELSEGTSCRSSKSPALIFSLMIRANCS